jgi:hypothetical protein
MVESGSGGDTLRFLVYITASSTFLKLVANGSQAPAKSRMANDESRNVQNFLNP